jgi:hypothetical protein|tara:strand:+ start:1144 stop:1314 length:171 start_codon:yes stop_codon:yes gene_type:complete
MKTSKTSKTSPEKEPAVALAQIPVDVLNQVLGYLSDKPYKEVQGLIVAIQENSKLV